jgi:hypothetical protein
MHRFTAVINVETCHVRLTTKPQSDCTDVDFVKKVGFVLFHLAFSNRGMGNVTIKISEKSLVFDTPRQFGQWASEFLERRGIKLLRTAYVKE